MSEKTGMKTASADEVFRQEQEAKARADEVRRQIAAEEERVEAERQARLDAFDEQWLAAAKKRGAELDRQEREGFRRFPDDLAKAFAGYITGRAAQIVKAELQMNAPSLGLPAGGIDSKLPVQIAGWMLVERLDGIIERLARDKADELLEDLAAQRRAVAEGE